jgi:hypothetical protein
LGLLKAVIVFTIVAGLALVGGGAFLLVQRATGTKAEATVSQCTTTGGSKDLQTDCTGSWIVGGSLLAGGHVVVGEIDGAGQSDVGKQIAVTVSGNTAYVRSPILAIVLLALGIVMLAGSWPLAKAVRK